MLPGLAAEIARCRGLWWESGQAVLGVCPADMSAGQGHGLILGGGRDWGSVNLRDATNTSHAEQIEIMEERQRVTCRNKKADMERLQKRMLGRDEWENESN